MPASHAPRLADQTQGDIPLQFGKYQLLRLLARGGMGEVFLARLVGELGFEKQLVIKTILPEFAAKPHFIEMFADEAKTAVDLSHGNIVPTYELGRVNDTFYIVMGYVDGPSVAQLLTSLRREKRPPSVPVALHIVRGVLTGLAYAHREEPERPAVVHRDISPRNVLLERSGQVRIVDFGISLRARERVNMRAGSVGYMAPEQARGEAADPRADVFGTACLLYALVTGDSPFPKEGVWSQPNLSLLPADLREPIAEALAFEPNERPADAGAFLKRLGPALAKHVSTFGDHELAVHLAETFPHGWRSGSAPASAGNTRLFDGPGQTFVTRLTEITSISTPAKVGRDDDSTPLPLAPPDDDERVATSVGTKDARPRFRLVAASVLLAGIGLGLALDREGDGSIPRTAPVLGPAVERVSHAWDDPAASTPKRGRLVEVEPADARLELDGHLMPGPGPYRLPESDGAAHVVKLMRPGYVDQEVELPPSATWPERITLDLDPEAHTRPKSREMGTLRVVAPTVPWAEVTVDGRSMGHTPTRNLELAPGRHRLEVRCVPDACPAPVVLYETPILIEPAQTLTVEATAR